MATVSAPAAGQSEMMNAIFANAAVIALQVAENISSAPAGVADDEDDLAGEGDRRKRKQDKRTSSGSKGSAGSGKDKDKDACRNQTGYIGVRQRKWGMFAAEIRDGDKRRWLGSFGTGREAGLAYDAAAISQKGNKAKTNFQYSDFSSVPRHGAEMVDSVRWDLLPKDIAERFPVPTNPGGMQGEDLDAAPSSRARSSARGVDQQLCEPLDAHEAQDQQPSKRSRSSSYGDGHDGGARHSAASYPPRFPPNGFDEHHLMGPANYYYTAPHGMWHHAADDLDEQEYVVAAAAAAAAYPHQHQYMMGPPPMMHAHAAPPPYDMPPYPRDPVAARKRSSGGISGQGAGSSSSPRGGLPPVPVPAKVVASAAMRATAATAFEDMAMGAPAHPYAVHYPMPYPPPKGYRMASGRGCTGSDGGARLPSGGGSRQHSDARRTSGDAVAGSAAAARRQRPSDDSLPLASLELDGCHNGTLDGAALHDAGLDPHSMMLHYADVGPYGAYELHPMHMAHHPGPRYHSGPYQPDPHASRSSQAGGDAMRHHHPGMPDYDSGLVPMSGFMPGYHPHAMAYGYPPVKDEDGEADGDDAADLAARWKDLTRGQLTAQSHAPMPRPVEEMEVMASLHHISMPGAGPQGPGAERRHPGHAPEGHAATQQQQQQRRQTSEVGDSAPQADVPPMSGSAASDHQA